MSAASAPSPAASLRAAADASAAAAPAPRAASAPPLRARGKTPDDRAQLTKVSTLVAGFLRRSAEAGVFFTEKHDRKVGMQRAINQNRAALAAYAANPALIKLQEQHGVRTLIDVGNWGRGRPRPLRLCGGRHGPLPPAL